MSIVFNVLVILLTASTYNFCQISTCLDTWTGPWLPRPRDQSGECGRYCKDTWICDLCNEISNTTADRIDAQLQFVPANGIICSPPVNTYKIAVAIVPRMIYGMTTSDAKVFARYLRFTGWNYDDGDCGNDVVIFVATKDRRVYTSTGSQAITILTSGCIQMIFEKAKKKYFSDSDFGGGVEFMVKEYKMALKTGECKDSTLLEDKISLYVVLVVAAGFIFVASTMTLITSKLKTNSVTSNNRRGGRRAHRGGGGGDGGGGGEGGGGGGGGGGGDGGGGGGGC